MKKMSCRLGQSIFRVNEYQMTLTPGSTAAADGLSL